MEITYLSILIFVITTIVYYIFPFIGKLQLTLDFLKDESTIKEFYLSNWIRLAIYFGLIVLSQYILNAIFIVNSCGGDTVSNFTNAFLITFMPWIFIFGIMILMLIIFPGFKSAFSDIIGYFIVAKSANDLLSQILVDKQVDNTLSEMTSSASTDKLRSSAESIMKLYTNKAILINQIVPENFMETWETLTPLMKPGIETNTDLKSKLLDIVVMRDNIGEACWYLYTAIVIISFTSYKMSSHDCLQNIWDVEEQSKKRQSEYNKKMAKTSESNDNKA
jgi:hypothetical protein